MKSSTERAFVCQCVFVSVSVCVCARKIQNIVVLF